MRNKHLLATIVFCCCMYSCTSYRYIYSSAPANSPFFKEKGDSKIAAFYSSSGSGDASQKYSRGFDLQGAYALTKHWAVTGNYFFRREKDYFDDDYSGPFDSSTVHYRRHLADAGAGYFTFFGNEKFISLNMYAGLGGGKFSFTDNGLINSLPYNRYHQSAITKWYLQPGINIFISRVFQLSYCTKFSFVHYEKIKTSYTEDELDYFSLDKIAGKTLYFFESSFDLRFTNPDNPWIMVDLITSSAQNNLVGESDSRLAIRSVNFSLGVGIDLFKMKKKKSKE